MDRHINMVAVTSEMFVHGIVQHLAHAMMQRALVRAADIHAGLFADRFESLELGQLGGVVIAIGNLVRRRDFFFRRISNTRHNFSAIPGQMWCGNEYEKYTKNRRFPQCETAVFLWEIYH